MSKFIVNIPEAVVYDSKMSMEEIKSFIRKITAMGFYLCGNILLGCCAEIDEMAEEEFICFLGENHIHISIFSTLTGTNIEGL